MTAAVTAPAPPCRRCRTNTPHTFKHGVNGYTYHRCRCTTCRAAMNGRTAAWREAHPGSNAASCQQWRERKPTPAVPNCPRCGITWARTRRATSGLCVDCHDTEMAS